MKSIYDYVDDIEDVLSQEGECLHRASHEEDGIYDSVERGLSARRRLEIQEILLRMREADYSHVMEIVSKVADERHEKERNETINTG